MIVKASKQGKPEFCQAIFNRELHANSICPANHDVDYQNGWFYFDGSPRQRPDLTAEVDEIMKTGTHVVGYWQQANAYILLPNEDYTPIEEDY